MDTLETIKSRRSIRKYKEDNIPEEILEEVIQAAIYSPSWKNTQITRYIAIENQELKNKIASEYVPAFNKQAVMTAPVLLALTVIKNRSGYERDGSFSTEKGNGWQMYDCGIASQTLCLAAHTYGLGTVIMGVFDCDEISKLLHVPQEQELTVLIAIGYPDIEPVMPKRKTVQDVLTIVH